MLEDVKSTNELTEEKTTKEEKEVFDNTSTSPVDEETKKGGKETTEKTTKETVEETMEKTMEESIDEPIEETVDEPAVETMEESEDRFIDESEDKNDTLIDGVEFIVDNEAPSEFGDEMERIINTMSESEAQEFLGIQIENNVVNNNSSSSFDHQAIAIQENVEFYHHGYSSNVEENENEVWNILESLRRTKHIIPATMIGSDCQSVTINRGGKNIKRYIMYALFRLPAPYDSFTIYVNFYDFFTEKERADFRAAHLSTGRPYPERGTREEAILQERILNRHTGYTFEITLEKTSKETNLITGSRVDALRRRFKQYFNRGIVVNGKLQKPQAGSIVKGCPITRITRKSVRVDICGIPTSIPLKEISYRFISSPYDIFKPGDIADVYICNIKKKNSGSKPDDVTIAASIKLAAPDPTIEALNKELSEDKILSNVLGKIVFVNPNRHCYHVYTEKGYNCIALSSKASSLKDTFGQSTSYVQEPKAGMKAIIKPYRIIGNVMIGVIVNCWW